MLLFGSPRTSVTPATTSVSLECPFRKISLIMIGRINLLAIRFHLGYDLPASGSISNNKPAGVYDTDGVYDTGTDPGVFYDEVDDPSQPRCIHLDSLPETRNKLFKLKR